MATTDFAWAQRFISGGNSQPFLSVLQPTSTYIGEMTSTPAVIYWTEVDSILTDYLNISFYWKNPTFGVSYYVVVETLGGTEVSRSGTRTIIPDFEGVERFQWRHGIPRGSGTVYVLKIYFQGLDTSPFEVSYDYDVTLSFVGNSIGSGGTTPGGGSNGGPIGGVNGIGILRDDYLARYQHGPTQVVVDGTSIQAAIDAMPNAGGIILVKESASPYASFNFTDRQFTAYCSVMAFPGHVPHISGLVTPDIDGNETGILIQGCTNVGVFGLEVTTINAQGHQYAAAIGIRDSHHVAIWSNSLHDATAGVGVIGYGGGYRTGNGANHVDTCYNLVYNTSGWLDTFASGISYFILGNVGGPDDSDGYSCRIVGNIVWNNFNDPSYGNAITDGNGIIIDITNGTYSADPIFYLGHVLIANNICINNGGAGVHAFFSRNVHMYFNTVGYNLRSSSLATGTEISQYGCRTGGQAAYNVVLTAPARDGWCGNADSSMVPQYNVVARGSRPSISGTNIDRTDRGDTYFTSANIIAPTAAGWRPVTADTFTVDSTVRAALQNWPDAAGNRRSTTGNWYAGAVDAAPVTPGGGGSGGGGTGISGSPTPPVAPIVTPESYGAVGDGITDDTAALQDALSHMQSIGGGTLVLTPGKSYTHNTVLHVEAGNINGGGYREGNQIVNAGILKATNHNMQSVFFDGPNTSAYGVIFSSPSTTRDVTFEHNKITLWNDGHIIHECGIESSAASGIFMEGASNYKITSCVVRNTNADSIHNSGGSYNGLITDPYIVNSGDDCVAVVTYGGQPLCSNITCLRPVIRGGRARGVSVVGGSNITYRDVDIQDTDYAGIYISSESEYSTEEVNGVLVSGGTLTRCAGGGGHPSILFYNSNQGINAARVENVTIYNQLGSCGSFIAAFSPPITNSSVSNIVVYSSPRNTLVDDSGLLTKSEIRYG